MRISFLAAAILAAAFGTGVPARAADLFAGARDGSLVVYGNYCGPGQRGVNPKPIDALDAACMRHDACTPVEGLPACSCHAWLRYDAHQVAMSPRHSELTRNMARFIRDVADILDCQ